MSFPTKNLISELEIAVDRQSKKTYVVIFCIYSSCMLKFLVNMRCLMTMEQNQFLEFYHNTDYILYPQKYFSEQEKIVLNIGIINLYMNSFLKFLNFKEYIFFTAANPMSQKQKEEENFRLNQNLQNFLESQNYFFVEALGKSKYLSWEEKSFCILGVNSKIGLKWAKEWRQNAFLYGQINFPPELIWS